MAVEVPFLDLHAQYAPLREQIETALRRVCDSQKFILGEEVEEFEKEAARYCGCKYALGVSSGSDALIMALMALEVGPGDEVLVPPFSFFATAGAVVRVGATPVFTEIEPASFNIDPEKISARISPRTKAIFPVHLFGQCAEMDKIQSLAARHDIAVIEDAAQAFGAEYRGRKAGTLGLMGCYSFFPSKNLGGFGDGGMIVTDDEALYRKLKLLRSHGAEKRYFHTIVGGNFRLDALQAAVLRVKLPHLDGWAQARGRHAELYAELLHDLDPRGKIILPKTFSGCTHVYNQFVVRIPERGRVQKELESAGIGCMVYYPQSLHEQVCFSALGYRTGDFPESERAAKEVLALPIYPELSAAQIERVAETLARLVLK